MNYFPKRRAINLSQDLLGVSAFLFLCCKILLLPIINKKKFLCLQEGTFSSKFRVFSLSETIYRWLYI